eukprot:TRINITY_DN96662_c0_g1_i1.p1 TRINITY_DN96662_c0_g1~~TRINITY_DN96662_c0_g1_i1.p1  ORF type:complete len:289 (+),score=58.39 TRINITY_DN96662_c0_g1_i1:100-966(+)
MVEQARMQQKAEALSARLALLEQQETRVKSQTEETQKYLRALAVAKQLQEQRVHDKVEALRELHRKDALRQGHVHQEPSSSLDLEEDDALPQLDVLPQLTSRSTRREQGWRETATPRVMSPKASPTPRTPRAGSTHYSQGPGAATFHSGFPGSGSQPATRCGTSRLQTSDILQNRHAQLAARKRLANSQREKIKLGGYSFHGNRMWMEPSLGAQGSPRPQKVEVPEKFAKMDTKELVDRMSKKEIEMKSRLEAAMKAQASANNDLASRLKSFSSVQTSACRAIREGIY